MGTFLGQAIETYGRLPWRDTAIDPAVYWADLCEWCIWEDWGIRHRRDTAPFRSARKGDVDLVEQILLDLEVEHRSHRLDYEADEALQLIAWLSVAARAYDRFVPAAERLRAEWWIPVDAMGEAAVKAGEPELAAEVYGAAVAGGGSHVDHLTRLCRQRRERSRTTPASTGGRVSAPHQSRRELALSRRRASVGWHHQRPARQKYGESPWFWRDAIAPSSLMDGTLVSSMSDGPTGLSYHCWLPRQQRPTRP